MNTVTALIKTDNAQRIMKRLSKHWVHKLPVTLTEDESQIELPMGHCRMQAGEVLKVGLQAEGDQMALLQQVVVDHLVRMASKETLTVNWQ